MTGNEDDGVRFGALLLPSQTWPEMVRRARAVEAAGFDALWIDDHIIHPARPQAHWLECWTTLAGLAGVTERITLGPLVSNIVLRPPALLARQALTVAEMSGGRVDLGVGSGYAPSDHEGVGVELWSGPERLRRFREAVATIRETLDAGPGETAGAGSAGDEEEPPPSAAAGHKEEQPASTATPGRSATSSAVPLTIAAHGRGALAVAAKHADTWASYGGFELDPDPNFALTRERSEILTELAAGRPIHRRLLCGSAALTREPIWQSVGAFEDFVGRYRGIGIDQFAFHWPPTDTNPAADPAVVEEIATRLPTLRGIG
jgi:alkanesulfonate monooxygenase SsuD/methylene tetrahydromethanopterin reductase-like flavin-dependent oxidoreductase (luciferase family)